MPVSSEVNGWEEKIEMAKEKAQELKDIRHAPGHDPHCVICHGRKLNRRYPDEIWNKAKERFKKFGSARVEIKKD
jgi:mono/diheme cytochrome c family protein